jgi:hypothetical protein
MTVRLLAAAVAAALAVAGCSDSGDQDSPAGEYAYATGGFERLSAVFSSTHRYPRDSTVVVARNGCGFTERWAPRAERSSESRFCVKANRWRLAALVDYHEFFGQAVTQRFACKGPFVPRPPAVQAGFNWTDRCRGAGSRVTVRYEAVKEQALEVAGRPVRTILIRARARLRGRIAGVNRIDSWLSRRNGLLIRRRVRSETTVDSPFGEISNRERYSLRLKSPTPG